MFAWFRDMDQMVGVGLHGMATEYRLPYWKMVWLIKTDLKK